jgi:hypothetical protein
LQYGEAGDSISIAVPRESKILLLAMQED